MRLKTKPFFSIIIPTYNRAFFLRGTIGILLRQTCKDFEIIISDNRSNDGTKETVRAFRDKRIRYFRNNINVGLTGNLQIMMSYPRGKYVVCLGDDDFLPFDDSLEQLKTYLEKTNVGFVRMNLIEVSMDRKKLEKKLLQQYADITMSAHSDPLSIMRFLFQVNVGGFAGLVLKNTPFLRQKFLRTECVAWFPLVFDTVERYGGYYASTMYVFIHWSVPNLKNTLEAYMVKNRRLNVEPLVEYCVDRSDTNNRHAVKKLILSQFVANILPIKLYTNNMNLVRFLYRLLTLDRSYLFNVRLWIYCFIALLIPKRGLTAVRFVHHKMNNMFKKKITNSAKLLQRYLYVKAKYYNALLPR